MLQQEFLVSYLEGMGKLVFSVLNFEKQATETDNTALYTIKKFDNEHAKLSCAPPNRYVSTELHCEL